LHEVPASQRGGMVTLCVLRGEAVSVPQFAAIRKGNGQSQPLLLPYYHQEPISGAAESAAL